MTVSIANFCACTPRNRACTSARRHDILGVLRPQVENNSALSTNVLGRRVMSNDTPGYEANQTAQVRVSRRSILRGVGTAAVVTASAGVLALDPKATPAQAAGFKVNMFVRGDQVIPYRVG